MRGSGAHKVTIFLNMLMTLLVDHNWDDKTVLVSLDERKITMNAYFSAYEVNYLRLLSYFSYQSFFFCSFNN